MTAITPPIMLTIAGSDPSGGAGIQADIKTASALGVYSMSVITAITAQNTLGVRGFEPVSCSMLEAQLDAIATDITPAAVKIGMLPDARSASIVAAAISRYGWKNVVLDPVMVATSGDSLSSGDTRHVLLHELAPLCTLITPNLPETEAFVGYLPRTTAETQAAAAGLLDLSGAGAVLIKGGHAGGDALVDLLCAPGLLREHFHRRVDTPNTHGTGCTLSSAIASLLARGMSLDIAVARAIGWLQKALQAGAALKIGHGHGPVNHLFEHTPRHTHKS